MNAEHVLLRNKKDVHLFSGMGLCNHLGRIFLIENQNIPWYLTNLQIEKSTSALCSNIAGERPEKFKILLKLCFSAFIKLLFSELRLSLVLYGSICCVDGQNLLLHLLLDGPRNMELCLPERSHNDILKQMGCIIKSLRMTSAVQTPQLLHSQFPFVTECRSFYLSSQWRRVEHSPCSDRGRHCSKGNTETCDYALTAVLPACWTAGIFLLLPLFTYHSHVFIKLL